MTQPYSKGDHLLPRLLGPFLSFDLKLLFENIYVFAGCGFSETTRYKGIEASGGNGVASILWINGEWRSGRT